MGRERSCVEKKNPGEGKKEREGKPPPHSASITPPSAPREKGRKKENKMVRGKICFSSNLCLKEGKCE